MFTGIVEELGSVAAMEPLSDDAMRLSINGPLVTSDAGHGDSIAVNGVCLTVVDNLDGTFTADVMRETLERSSLGDLEVGSAVNLERAVTLGTRLGGHIVQGHVDGTGTIVRREPSENWEYVTIRVPLDLSRYIVHKGSITFDGVSLTVASFADADEATDVTVSLIPTTLAMTTLGTKTVGQQVNIEVDVLAKHIERLIARGTGE